MTNRTVPSVLPTPRAFLRAALCYIRRNSRRGAFWRPYTRFRRRLRSVPYSGRAALRATRLSHNRQLAGRDLGVVIFERGEHRMGHAD
jgi:hypothetical protein